MVYYIVISAFWYDIMVLLGSDTMNMYIVLWCIVSCVDKECVKAIPFTCDYYPVICGESNAMIWSECNDSFW